MDFGYIVQNVAGPGVEPAELEQCLQGCQCIGECSSASGCACLVDGKPNYDAATGRFLQPSDASTSAHIECGDNCECALCPERCLNRRVQRGVQFKLRVAKCPGKGLGVFAGEPIPAGHFVVEYVGELISREEAERRLAAQRTAEEHNYLFTIREHIGGNCHFTFIDGRHKGNVSRLINHSCEPNLQLQVIRLGRPSPSLAMFAVRDIAEGEELAYSYGFLSNSPDGTNSGTSAPPLSVKPCLCAAPSCQGRLPSANTI